MRSGLRDRAAYGWVNGAVVEQLAGGGGSGAATASLAGRAWPDQPRPDLTEKAALTGLAPTPAGAVPVPADRSPAVTAPDRRCGSGCVLRPPADRSQTPVTVRARWRPAPCPPCAWRAGGPVPGNGRPLRTGAGRGPRFGWINRPPAAGPERVGPARCSAVPGVPGGCDQVCKAGPGGSIPLGGTAQHSTAPLAHRSGTVAARLRLVARGAALGGGVGEYGDGADGVGGQRNRAQGAQPGVGSAQFRP